MRMDPLSHFELDASHRETLTTERAEQLLCGLTAGVTSVKLGGKSFGDGSASVAATALARAAPTLRHLDIADIIAARPEEEAKRALATIADGLSEAKSLVSIDLSDNALGAKGVRAVGPLLEGQTDLQSLKLCNNGLAADAGSLITAALTKTSPTKLKLLHFHNNLLESTGAKSLAPIVEASPDLEDFRFSSLRIDSSGAVRISEAIKRSAACLKRLNLSDNTFGLEGSKALASALLGTLELRELILRDTGLGNSGVVKVAAALQKAQMQLEVLDLSGNEMKSSGARAMANAVKDMGYLRKLHFEDNEIGSNGAIAIAEALSPDTHVTLEEIFANACEVGSSGAHALAVKANELPVLAILDLNGNCVGEDMISQINELLGEKLGSLSDNDCDAEEEVDEDEEDEDEEDEEEEEEEEKTEKDDEGDREGTEVEGQDKHPVGHLQNPHKDDKGEPLPIHDTTENERKGELSNASAEKAPGDASINSIDGLVNAVGKLSVNK